MRFALLGFLPLISVSCCAEERVTSNLLIQPGISLIVLGAPGGYNVGAVVPDGVDPQRVASDILWYLKHDPAFLDSDVAMTWLEPKGPRDPRGRDYWAAAAADIMGVEFHLLYEETSENRDRKIRSLLETTVRVPSDPGSRRLHREKPGDGGCNILSVN
jgi:hypothetical protein